MNIKRLLAVILAMMLLCGAALAEESILTVQGTGVVSLDPDMATITLGVRETSKDVSQAQASVNQKLADVIEKLHGMGIVDEDIHTSTISIYEDYGYGSTGEEMRYAAQNTISVTIRDIENAGQYIDAVFEAGANTFSDIRFGASDTEDAKKRALELSVENARLKAEVLAAAAGMRITGIRSIAEQGVGYGGIMTTNRYDAVMEKAEAESDVGTAVFSEQIQVSATVTIEYTMAPVE